jgi:hypothetical protein
MFGPLEGCRFRNGRTPGESSRDLWPLLPSAATHMHDARPSAVHMRNLRLCPGHKSKVFHSIAIHVLRNDR